MKLSLFYFTYFLFILLSAAGQTEYNINSCPTSRRLLFLGGLNLHFPLGEKKSEHISSSSSSKSSSPPKYARTDTTHGLTVYIRPQTSNELGHKVRSYSHLLKSKLFTKEERAKLKSEKKKKSSKKNTTQHATKTRDLVAINDQERDRCRALLHIEHQETLTPTKITKKLKKTKNAVSSKVKDITNQAKKKIEKALPVENKQKAKKVKPTKSTPNEKKKSVNKPSETQPLTPPPLPPPVKELPIKTPPPPPPPQSSINSKPKREKPTPPPPVIIQPTEALDIDDNNDMDNDEKNNSVVGRAYHFVKNMFQLSDDILDNNHTHEEDQILPSTNEQQHRQSRKLLSIDDLNERQSCQVSDDLLFPAVNIFKRQLLSVKTNKRSTPSSKPSNTKEKKTGVEKTKPKVGWAYRYRISRYLADPKMKRTGYASKALGGGKAKQQLISKQSNKKISSSSNTKISKRKLLELGGHDESSSNYIEMSNPDIINSVYITQTFVPKRQLLASKKVEKVEKPEEESPDEDDKGKTTERRRIKSYEELTDPIEIVRSYDRGLFKPRVGWQFRYRVSRYIDSLRENIREDQQRLKLGLQAIKRKTPQELSGRRKRVLDKPFAPEPEETPTIVEVDKPNVGWRYRYRISKMLDAKQRGEYIDDDEEKRKARTEQKRKPQVSGKPTGDDEECIEWEFDLDPELRKISEEGKRVGWAYRYRVRRRLDELKQNQAETGVSFDIETLGGKREKKPTKGTTSTTPTSDEKVSEVEKKVVGWQYRYRVSKMREALKNEPGPPSKKSISKKYDQLPLHERPDPILAKLTPQERVVGWQYRYRIRRKFDTIRNTTRETEGGKRSKKHKHPSEGRLSSSKRKEKEKIIKKVEESIEKILNIDDIDETPFMEYVRRASIYIFSGLIPTARRSICLLPLPVTFSFCKEDDEDTIKETPTLTTTELPKTSSPKKLRTKKEKRAKQFIRPHSTKLETINEKIDEPIKPSTKTIEKQSHQRLRSSIRRNNNDEQIKHFDEEEQPIKKLVGVESKKKNKKRFQIIGQTVKIKHKNSQTPAPVTTTTASTPITTTESTPVTTADLPPIVTTHPPVVETPQTTHPPPPPPPPATPEPEIVLTTTHAPLRSISEIIQEEAATLLTTQDTFSEEVKEEINEVNENLETTTPSTTTSPPDVSDSSSSDEDEPNESASSSSASSSSDSDDDDDPNEKSEETDGNFDPLALKKMKQYYETAKESVHGAFDLNEKNDSP